MTDLELVALCKGIAVGVHTGQTDKAGKPYIDHPRRVAERCESPDAKAVAWLHDTVEDGTIELQHLAGAGVSLRVVQAVGLLTHYPNENRQAYYERILNNSLALEVKIADIADNTDPDRFALLDEPTRERLAAKYEMAMNILRNKSH